jgi:hypothetical protein
VALALWVARDARRDAAEAACAAECRLKWLVAKRNLNRERVKESI